jgi:hypothetical protein
MTLGAAAVEGRLIVASDADGQPYARPWAMLPSIEGNTSESEGSAPPAGSNATSTRKRLVRRREEPTFRRRTSFQRRKNIIQRPWAMRPSIESNPRENEGNAASTRKHLVSRRKKPSFRRRTSFPRRKNGIARPWRVLPSIETSTSENQGTAPHDRKQHCVHPEEPRPSTKGAVLSTSRILPSSEEGHATTVGSAPLHRDQHVGETGQRASRPGATRLPPGGASFLDGRSHPSDVARPADVGSTSSHSGKQGSHPCGPSRGSVPAARLRPRRIAPSTRRKACMRTACHGLIDSCGVSQGSCMFHDHSIYVIVQGCY